MEGKSSIPLFFHSLILLLLLITPTMNAQPEFLGYRCSDDLGNYTTNITYQTNLHALLSSLISNDNISNVFYSSSAGENPDDKVYATGLCGGDLKPDACRSCLNDSTNLLTRVCPNQKEAIGWYERCTLRYSSRYLLGIKETQPYVALTNVRNVSSDVDEFVRQLKGLFQSLRSRAGAEGSSRKFASGNLTERNSFGTLYALVQCSPDLSAADCSDCIVDGVNFFEECCYGSKGIFVSFPSCRVVYGLDRFYDPTADELIQLPLPPPPPTQVAPPSPPVATVPPSTTNDRGKGNNTAPTVIIVVVPVVIAFLLLLICGYVYFRMRKPKENLQTHPSREAAEEIGSSESLQFDLSTIRVATNDFSEENKLGQGGFGAVYRGTLSNGQEIAVKRLSRNSGQGDLEFKNEILLVAKLLHRNLVRSLGFCLERNERLLVYEFVPNKSLDYFIFDPSKRASLDWDKRYKIIKGIARGLLYLHEDSQLRIIHRDLKASNILLNEEMNPKISDFGMARLFLADQTQDNTSRIVGTYGYMAPEYAMHGQFSVKSDVFSFGVLLLEILSGQKNNSFQHGERVEDLLSYAWRNWREGTASNLIDPLIIRAGAGIERMRCIHIGLLCVQENVANRPNMNKVVLMLNSYSLSLPVPSEPAFFMHSNSGSKIRLASAFNSRVTESDHSINSKSDSVAQASANYDDPITELYPR